MSSSGTRYSSIARNRRTAVVGDTTTEPASRHRCTHPDSPKPLILKHLARRSSCSSGPNSRKSAHSSTPASASSQARSAAMSRLNRPAIRLAGRTEVSGTVGAPASPRRTWMSRVRSDQQQGEPPAHRSTSATSAHCGQWCKRWCHRWQGR